MKSPRRLHRDGCGPTDIHTIGRNASQTKPAKFLVLLFKDVNALALIPVK